MKLPTPKKNPKRRQSPKPQDIEEFDSPRSNKGGKDAGKKNSGKGIREGQRGAVVGSKAGVAAGVTSGVTAAVKDGGEKKRKKVLIEDVVEDDSAVISEEKKNVSPEVILETSVSCEKRESSEGESERVKLSDIKPERVCNR